jgi:integrase
MLHGLRHTFIRRSSNLGGSEKLQMMLTGHSARDIHSKVYDHKGNVPMKWLKNELEKLQYPEVFQALKTTTA